MPPCRRRAPLRALVLGAAAVLVLSCLYGIAAPFLTGHHGFHGGDYANRARNTLRHGIIIPANWIGQARPGPERYYLHHPILTHQLVTLAFLTIGEREHAIRIAAALTYLASLLTLWLLVRRLHGPAAAALAAWVYVLLPVNLWFGFNLDTRYPAMACAMGYLIFYHRWLDAGRRRDAAWALGLIALAGFFDWIPYLYAVPLGIHAAAVGLRRRGRYLAFAPLLALAVLLPLGIHALLVYRTGHVDEMVQTFQVRSRVMELRYFVETMKNYAYLLYGPVIYWALHLWAALLLLRTVALRLRVRDLASITFLVAFLTYLRLFRQASVIHQYVMLYGNVVCALAAVDLAEAARASAAWVVRRVRGPSFAPQLAGAVVGVGLVLAMAPEAWRALLESRTLAGNPPPKRGQATAYEPGATRVAFANVVSLATTAKDTVLLHPSFPTRNDLAFNLDRDLKPLYAMQLASSLPPAEQARSVVLFTLSGLDPQQRRVLGELARQHPLHLVEQFGMLDLRRSGAALRVDRAVLPRSRGWLSRFLVGPHPLPRLEQDPRREAALRSEFGVPSPAGP